MGKMPDVLRSDARGRVTIPKKIRERIGYDPGQPLQVRLKDGKIVLSPIAKDPEKRLDEVLGEITFDRKARRKAEKWLKEESS